MVSVTYDIHAEHYQCGKCCLPHDSVADAESCCLPRDVVNSPEHYRQGGIEAIDAIQASMTREEFKGYLKANCMKYLWRYRHKGKPVEDLRKAKWYLDRLLIALGEE